MSGDILGYQVRLGGHYLDGRRFGSEEEAAEAIGRAFDWPDPVCSPSFPVGDGNTYAVCVYETEAECDADGEGAYAPRVVGVRACERCGAEPVAEDETLSRAGSCFACWDHETDELEAAARP